MSILHLAFRDDWDAALASGSYPWSTRGATIEDVGFLHACHDRAQLAGVAGRFYADVTAPLLVLELDEAELAAAGLEVRDEPGRPGDADAERFPHVYGARCRPMSSSPPLPGGPSGASRLGSWSNASTS